MAEVIAKIQVVPEKDANLEEIKEKIRQIVSNYGDLNNIEEKPFVFGLKALYITVFVEEEKPENLDKIEEELGKIENVNSSEVIDINRV